MVVQFILVFLSVFSFCFVQAEALSSEEVIPVLTQGNWVDTQGEKHENFGHWGGTYQVKFVLPKGPRLNQFHFSSPGVMSPKQDGVVLFHQDEKTGLLQYIFQRATSSEKTETDYMICNQKFSNWSLPRKMIFKNNLQTLIDQNFKPELMAKVKKMFDDPESFLHKGAKRKYDITDDVVAVTIGKKCGKNDSGKNIEDLEDLIYPVHSVDFDRENNLHMGAILGLIQLSQGYTYYHMQQLNR